MMSSTRYYATDPAPLDSPFSCFLRKVPANSRSDLLLTAPAVVQDHATSHPGVAPVPDPTVEGRLYQIPGQPPDLAHLPAGCPFAPRCERAEEICTREFPPFVELTSNHHSLCHFAGEVFAETGS